MDLDTDQRGCIVFPKSVGTHQISRISGAVTQRFLCGYHLPRPPLEEEECSSLPQGGARRGTQGHATWRPQNSFECAFTSCSDDHGQVPLPPWTPASLTDREGKRGGSSWRAVFRISEKMGNACRSLARNLAQRGHSVSDHILPSAPPEVASHPSALSRPPLCKHLLLFSECTLGAEVEWGSAPSAPLPCKKWEKVGKSPALLCLRAMIPRCLPRLPKPAHTPHTPQPFSLCPQAGSSLPLASPNPLQALPACTSKTVHCPHMCSRG